MVWEGWHREVSPYPDLISGAVAAETTAPLVPLGEHVLRGIAAPCAVFTLPNA